MADFSKLDNMNTKPKTFWQRPEGVTGSIFLAAIIGALGYLVVTNIGFLTGLASSMIGLIGMVAVLGLLIFLVLDSKTRTLVSYMYKSMMRNLTSWFVTIDPIGILKNYIADMEDNYKKLGKQIGDLRGQMRQLKGFMKQNNADIDASMSLARKAKELGQEKPMLLNTRKAARLKDSNAKYHKLHGKISILYKVLSKMHSNSEILIADTKDQVKVKEQERKAIRASHSAMKSAMNIISGNSDKRAMFDQALEVIADDVANKVGEMEQFMEMSSGFMDSIDLQNGMFEEQGLKMLAEYEKKSTLLLLGGNEENLETLDLNEPQRDVQYQTRTKSSGNESSKYDQLFD